MFDSTTRFSNRVENYIKYRPGYPPEIITYLKEQKVLKADSVIADIGSGTGISSELFLKNGNIVYGVEPNKEMREAGEKLLSKYKNFISVKGTAENSTLNTNSIDLITAGQAFHWFDIEKAKSEFKSIIKPNGFAALIWNIKNSKASPLMLDYEQLQLKHGTDYKKVRHENIGENEFNILFENGYKQQFFDNEQVLDYEGLKGRLLSASYIPSENEPGYEALMNDLNKMFEKYNENGKVTIFYNTEVVWGRI